MLNINRTVRDGTAFFGLEGRLDTLTAPVLEAQIREVLDGISKIEIDMEKLAYISSAGLRVLLSTHKEMLRREGMKVTNVPEAIADIFEVTGFSEILTIG